jgi:hypothetical protein
VAGGALVPEDSVNLVLKPGRPKERLSRSALVSSIGWMKSMCMGGA